MAQTKHDIQALLTQAGLSPRHRFGQNFMIDQNLVRLIAQTGQIAPGDRVIEVGPGTGTLTEELLARDAQVIAVEIDHDLAALLRVRFAAEPAFALIEADALASKHRLNSELQLAIQRASAEGRPAKLIANLPYNIASPLIIELLLVGVELLVFTVQKEVAHRLRAKAGDEEYGALSVMSHMLARTEILRTLPPQVFWPAPQIESALVRMVRAPDMNGLGPNARAFGEFVQSMFSYRRKMLRNALDVEDVTRFAHEAGVEPTARPEEIHPDAFYKLFLSFQQKHQRKGA